MFKQNQVLEDLNLAVNEHAATKFNFIPMSHWLYGTWQSDQHSYQLTMTLYPNGLVFNLLDAFQKIRWVLSIAILQQCGEVKK